MPTLEKLKKYLIFNKLQKITGIDQSLYRHSRAIAGQKRTFLVRTMLGLNLNHAG
jgi:hypothetical protein